MRAIIALILFVLAVACTEPLAPGLDGTTQLADLTLRPGRPSGVTGVNSADWCKKPFMVGVSTADPRWIKTNLERAAGCGMRVYFNFGRHFMTTDGSKSGRFSITKAKAYVDRLARDNAVYKRYVDLGVLIGFQTLDDMNCKPCWGGIGVTQRQTAELTRYAASKLGDPTGVPIWLRVEPEWMLKNGGDELVWNVDVTTSQWHTKKGDQRTWYERQRVAGRRLGITKHNWAVNVQKCDGGGNDAPNNPCTPTELRRYVGLAIGYPDGCASVSWRYDADYTLRGDYRDAWDDLLAKARSMPTTNCK